QRGHGDEAERRRGIAGVEELGDLTVVPVAEFGESRGDEETSHAAIIAQAPTARRTIHSITWSARRISPGGMVTPRAFAVFRLITSSNFVGCSTGSSAGF